MRFAKHHHRLVFPTPYLYLMSRSYYYQLLACWNIQATAIYAGEGHCYNIIILCAWSLHAAMIIDGLYRDCLEAATIVCFTIWRACAPPPFARGFGWCPTPWCSPPAPSPARTHPATSATPSPLPADHRTPARTPRAFQSAIMPWHCQHSLNCHRDCLRDVNDGSEWLRNSRRHRMLRAQGPSARRYHGELLRRGTLEVGQQRLAPPDATRPWIKYLRILVFCK